MIDKGLNEYFFDILIVKLIEKSIILFIKKELSQS